MRAMVLDQPGPIESQPLTLRDMDAPVAGAGELLVRVVCCGVCRTDLHVIEGDLPPRKLPLIVGHQVVGRVEAMGAGCSLFAVGQRIGIAWLRHTDGTCKWCRRGRENLCPASQYAGYTHDGGYAELAVVPEAYAYTLPEGFDDVAAAPLLCAGIIGYRALRRANVPDGGRLLLIGFGSSAHIVLPIALHRGCEVYVASRADRHLTLAKRMGATWVGHNIAELPHKVDAAINFAPSGALVPAALEQLEPGGTLSIAGIHVTDVPTLNYVRHLFHERDIHTVTANTRDDGRELLREAAVAGVKPHTTTYDLADANRALLDMKHSRIDGTAVLVV